MQPKLTEEYLASQGLSKTFPQRFWAKVNKTESCWLWTGVLSESHGRPGYGLISKQKRNGNIRAHRASWIMHCGPIPEGLWVLHDCPGGDNKACVNPKHLWLGTMSDNMRDGFEKGQYPRRLGRMVFNRKLTQEQADEIRSQYVPHKFGAQKLANKFGVSKRAIQFVLSDESYVRKATVR